MLSSLNKRQKSGLFVGPLLFAVLLLLPVPEGMSPQALRVAAVALLMATFWMAETLAIPVTALLPIILFPLLGVMPTEDVTLAYGDQILFLFMGGFIIAIAMQKWNLHRRIALTVIRKVGSSPERLVLGMMLATALISMWVSNTATAMMMTPVGIAVIESTRRARQGQVAMTGQGTDASGQVNRPDNFAVALMLSIAYAASIGGFSTLVGTPPNAIFIGQLDRLYGQQVGFLDWMLMALPISICVLALCWFLLARVFFWIPNAKVDSAEAREYIAQELAAMGPITPEERRVAGIFALVAVAWVTRGLLDQLTPESALYAPFAGLLAAPAWGMVSDSAIAMAGAFLLFIVPASKNHEGFLMDWDSAVKLPWDVILLMGGGFALAEGFTITGLTEWLAGQFGILQGMPILLLTMIVVVFVVFIGETTSNAATATMFIPVMGALAVSMDLAPLTLMVPTVLATSLGFMLPVATPPNATVFGSRYLTIEDMVKAGFWLNVGGALIVSVLCYALMDIVQ